MFPLKDSIPRVHPSLAVWALMGVNALVFFYQLGLGRMELVTLLQLWGLVPLRLLDPQWALGVGYPDSGLATLVTYTFLHAGWLHFLINMWSLWIFADNIEDVMGPWRFLGFYFLCGALAGLAHMVMEPSSFRPVVGASGAIAGVMGAYFLLYPHAKVLTLIPVFIFPLFVELPALLYLGLWFLLQLFSGVAGLGQEAGGVAFWTHAGGFLAGMLLLPLFRIKSRCYYCYDPDGRRIPYRERGVPPQ